jgi:hypothetical protein
MRKDKKAGSYLNLERPSGRDMRRHLLIICGFLEAAIWSPRDRILVKYSVMVMAPFYVVEMSAIYTLTDQTRSLHDESVHHFLPSPGCRLCGSDLREHLLGDRREDTPENLLISGIPLFVRTPGWGPWRPCCRPPFFNHSFRSGGLAGKMTLHACVADCSKHLRFP